MMTSILHIPYITVMLLVNYIYAGSNDYVNNFLQPFMADGQQYTHDEFIELLISTLDQQLKVNENVTFQELN